MDKVNEESQEWTCVYFSPSPDKAIEESQEWTGFYFSPSPSYFPQSPPPPFQFSPSPPPSCPPSPNSFVVCQLASQSMEMSLQNQQHDDSLDPPPQYFDRYWALVQQQLLQLWTDTLNLITRGRIMSAKMSEQYNSQGFFRSPAPEYVGVWQGHGSEWVARIRLRWNWLIIGTFETAEEAAIAHDEAALRFRGVGARLNFPKRVSTTVPSMDTPPPPPPQLPSTAQKENRNEDSGLVNDEVEVAIGIGVEGTREGEVTEDQLNSGCLGKRKRNEKSLGGESGNKKTDGVRAGISLDDILQTKAMSLKDATKNVNVSRSTLECTCRECGIHIWPPHKLISQSHANETPTVVDQEQIPQSISETLLPFSEVETVEIGGEGTVNGEMEESQLNSECLVKGKRKVKTRGETGNKKTTGVRIAIALEDILQAKGMLLKDAAKHLKVSISTLKRVCRGYQIYRWPPREEHKSLGQSRPNEALAVGDQERNPQLNFAMQPSNQESASIDTSSVTVKARYEGETFKFQLSKQPWEMAELQEQVKKRLKLKAQIKYEDEDGELISIACDDDLRYHISRSRSQDTTSIVVLLQRKR